LTLPRPEPGVVIRYVCLWLSEYREGREEGAKDRPCAVVLNMVDDEGETCVTVLPITHIAPADRSTAIALPIATKIGSAEGARNRYAIPGRRTAAPDYKLGNRLISVAFTRFI
jgi:hypothetical protein